MKIALKELGEIITGNTPSKKNDEFYSSRDIAFVKPDIISDKFITEMNEVDEYISENARSKARIVSKGAILVTCIGSIGKIGIISDGEYAFNQQINAIIPIEANQKYLAYNLLYNKSRLIDIANAPVVPIINKTQFGDFEILYCSDKKIQQDIVYQLDCIMSVIDKRQKQLKYLDELVKARFVEMFGDFKINDKSWKMVSFKDCACIDTKMIHDFTGYEDYPHIGIDSIEKNSGKLLGYRTISEDNVISGKYLFSSKHIIYSKIRPNLNKVALPDFDGLCSADAYPILVKDKICNRVFLGYTMRSQYYLDYILAFSSRTNMPKVNKVQVESFVLPLPPIELQNKFAEFVQQVDKSKSAIKKSLEETQILFDSLMQKYFG